MGYYTRQDIPFHYALADAFTVCDNYHCSVLGPSQPNHVMAISGTIDPAERAVAPVLPAERAWF
jgi:phospholipase C